MSTETNPTWEVGYDNDTGPNDESFHKWLTVSKGDVSFTYVEEHHANELCELLNGMATGTEASVIADIARRQQVGIAKYGVTVRDNPLSLRQWLQHAYEETLDQAVYLKRAIEEMDKS